MAARNLYAHNPSDFFKLVEVDAIADHRVTAVTAYQALNLKIGVNLLDINKTRLQSVTLREGEQDQSLSVPIRVLNKGVAFVIADYDLDNTNTYKVFLNKPVCINLSNIRHVTGINPHWTLEEFIIIGIALADWTFPGSKTIPIHLIEQPLDIYRDITFTLVSDLAQGGSAEAVATVRGEVINITVHDAWYKNISGFTGDVGFAQSINGKFVVKTLICSIEEDED